MIAVTVVIAGFLLTPTYIYSKVITYEVPGLNRSVEKCMFDMDSVTSHQFLVYIFVCGYCIPFVSMVFFYASILRTLWKKNASAAAASETTVAEAGSRAQRGQKRAQHVTQRALLLVCFYFGKNFCHFPYNTFIVCIFSLLDTLLAHSVLYRVYPRS